MFYILGSLFGSFGIGTLSDWSVYNTKIVSVTDYLLKWFRRLVKFGTHFFFLAKTMTIRENE